MTVLLYLLDKHRIRIKSKTMILKIIKKMSVTGMRMIIKLCKFISNKKSVVKINVKLNTNVKYLLVKHDGRH